MECCQVSKDGTKLYQAEAQACRQCETQPRCCRSKSGRPRTVKIDNYEHLRQAMARKMSEPKAREAYRRRKAFAGPVFGHMKNLGFRGLRLRGLEKVKGEFAPMSAAHNFLKIVRAVVRGIHFEQGQMMEQAASRGSLLLFECLFRDCLCTTSPIREQRLSRYGSFTRHVCL